MNCLNSSCALEHDTNPDKPKYRPPFLDHFDRKKTEPPTIMPDLKALHQQQMQQVNSSQHHAAAMQHQHAMSPQASPVTQTNQQPPSVGGGVSAVVDTSPCAPSLHNLQAQQDAERDRYLSHLQLQLNQISAANQLGLQHLMHGGGAVDSQQQASEIIVPRAPMDGGAMKYQRNFVDGEFEFVCLVLLIAICKSLYQLNIA